jgi:chromosome segregation ATPase
MQQEHDAAVAQLRQDNTQLAQALQQIHAESAAELRAANEKIQAVLTNCEGHVREAEEKERSLSVSICAAEDQKKRYENQLAQMELLSVR